MPISKNELTKEMIAKAMQCQTAEELKNFPMSNWTRLRCNMLRAEPTIQIVIIIMLKSAINTSDEKSSRFLEEYRERIMSSVRV